MELSARRQLFNACDPAEALGLGDPRYVDLDAIGHPPARGSAWIAILAAPAEAPGGATSSMQVVAATPGSGLSTALAHLAGRLRDPDRANLIVAHADAAAAIDLTAPLDFADMLLLLVGAACDALTGAGCGAPADLGRRMRRWLPESAGGASGAHPQWLGVLRDLRLVAALRERFRAVAHAESSRFLADVRADLAAARDAARNHGRADVIVIVDSLERLGARVGAHDAVVASAERFLGDLEHLDLPVHTIYSAPPALLLRPRWSVSAHVLPALRVVGRDGRSDEAGVAAARALVRARASDDELAELLGGAAREDRVAQMIAWSAGLPRDLVKLLRRVAAREAIGEGTFDGLLGEVGETQGRLLLRRSYPALARVHADQSLPRGDEVATRDLGLALDMGAVLPYRDARGLWLDVAPAVRELCGVAV